MRGLSENPEVRRGRGANRLGARAAAGLGWGRAGGIGTGGGRGHLFPQAGPFCTGQGVVQIPADAAAGHLWGRKEGADFNIHVLEKDRAHALENRKKVLEAFTGALRGPEGTPAQGYNNQ